MAVLTVAPLIFELAILGPLAVVAPLSTYTDLLPATQVADSVLRWYSAPGQLWGAYHSDDFLAPASLMCVVALISLFLGWFKRREAMEIITAGRKISGR
jgi:hypothetical protein